MDISECWVCEEEGGEDEEEGCVCEGGIYSQEERGRLQECGRIWMRSLRK